jgi:hypothetical protein
MDKSSSFGNNENASINTPGASNVTNVSNLSSSVNVVGGGAGGKLVPKDISKSVDIANSSNRTIIITNSTVVGTNVSITSTQNVTNVTAEKKDAERWCIIGNTMNSARIPGSNEWIVSDMRYYGGKLYCYANKSGSTTNYLFNEEYLIVYSVEGTDRPTYTLLS